MIRLLVILAAAAAALGVTVTVGAARSAGTAPTKATVVIRHQMRGCHSWSVNGNAYRPTQSTRLVRGGTMTFINNDVMPHKLIQKSGPTVRHTGKAAMSHVGASVKVVFPKAGVYHFTTRAGEDYSRGIKTIGEDNVLLLTVTVP